MPLALSLLLESWVAVRPGGNELTTAEWRRQFFAAADLGALHVGLLRRRAPFPAGSSRTHSRRTGSGPLHQLDHQRPRPERARRLGELVDAGLDSIQISFQADQPELGDQIAGIQAHERKLEAVRLVKATELPLTLNVVLHRGNVDRLADIIAFAERLGAERLELANTQFYGWAFQNRRQLLPSREQVSRAAAIAAAATKRLHGRMELLSLVIPDYFAERPKPCMHGWGMRMLTVNPHGDVLPCPTAGEIKSLTFDNVRDRPLAEIWREGSAFQRFRGIGMDARPVQVVQFPRSGLRRLPLPGRLADGRSSRH